MAPRKKLATKLKGGGGAPPPETDPVTPPTGDTPESIAAEFVAAIKAEDAEKGSKLGDTVEAVGTRKSRTATPANPVDAIAPQWTAEGIGRVNVSLHDMVFEHLKMAELDPIEREELGVQTARGLNALWPTGAKYEAPVAFGLTELAIWGPRLAALQLRRRMEQEEREAQEAQRIERELRGAK